MVEAFALLAEGAGSFDAFGCHDGWPTPVSALSAGGFETGVGAFDDHAAFHLRERGHDVKNEFPAGRGGVESFCEGAECDSAFAELVDGVDDVSVAAAKSVEFPDDEYVAVMVA